MTVGICGLGLIGGSMAMAYKKAGHTVLAHDKDITIEDFAALSGVIDGKLNADTVPSCELILVALYPVATMAYMEQIAPYIDRNAVLMDLCGTKQQVCACGMALAERYGFTFVGGHPMAGSQYSGFKHAKATLFLGAPMVIVPPVYDDMALLDRIRTLLSPAGFGRLSVTTADNHDRVIAFTSQLAHVVSNAYVKSPTAQEHKGFSAGSYKDLTRVAWLNEAMWSELFLENKEPLLFELDTIIASLQAYRDAIADDDLPTLTELLREGRILKERIDG
ncbi:MAG: prephenate dehydrogenase [Ruminococcaceae bacterium]|nr:prephenate dehydrogenase [Oscillospiraceae bacterium]